MKFFWRIAYALLFGYAIWGGYGSLSPQRTSHTNPDWVFVSITFVLMILFPLGAMFYARSRGVSTFRRPSFDRFPLGWWTDTLQPLRVTLVLAASNVLGCL